MVYTILLICVLIATILLYARRFVFTATNVVFLIVSFYFLGFRFVYASHGEIGWVFLALLSLSPYLVGALLIGIIFDSIYFALIRKQSPWKQSVSSLLWGIDIFIAVVTFFSLRL